MKQKKYKNLKISRQLRDIIHGYIMSDGYVQPSGNLTVDQSKKQTKFVMWLYDKFKSIRTDHPISDVVRVDSRTGIKSFSKRFNTKNLLHGFRNMWYKPYLDEKGNTKYLKSLPKSLDCFFSPEFISLWFAGDGTKIISSLGCKIEVTNFSPDERKRLQKLFKTKYNISAAINKAGKSSSGKEQWTISINSADYYKFKGLITQIDLIPTLFPNKLHS
jgi:hypothetical protein